MSLDTVNQQSLVAEDISAITVRFLERAIIYFKQSTDDKNYEINFKDRTKLMEFSSATKQI